MRTRKIFLLLIILLFSLTILFLGSKVSLADESTGGLVPCTDKCTLCHLVVGFYNIYKFFLSLIFTATILFIVVAGVIYMTSSGVKAMMDWAKKALTYSLTGAILLLCSWLLVTAVMTALGATNVGSWWNYTCDTSQTTSSSTGTGTKVTTTGAAGTCQGISTQSGIDKQCSDVSPALSGLLACMKDKLPSGAQISSISDGNGGLSCYTDNSSWGQCSGSTQTSCCFHKKGSCHYGGTCTDGSHAADISTKNASGTEITNAANNCGANYVLDEGNHIHVSMGQDCGCN